MVRRFLASALLAGLLAGLGVTALQQVTTAPLIRAAERYEAAGQPRDHGRTADRGQPHAHRAQDGGWAPANGLERLAFTALANLLAGVGFAFVLVACLAFRGNGSTGRSGVLWGLAGFAVFTLAPSLGLAPELPTMNAAGLMARQVWWIGAAAATAAGLWLLVFVPRVPAIAAGVVLIALPHVVGAPHPHGVTAQIPPELAARFAAASIGTAAVFWVSLGWLAGTLYGRGRNATGS